MSGDNFSITLNETAKRAQQRGAFDAFDSQVYRQSWFRCTVFEVHPKSKTCTVVDEKGRWYPHLPIPVKNRDPVTGAGVYSMPKRGTEYLISCDPGYPTLLEYNSEQTAPRSDGATQVLLGSGEDSDAFLDNNPDAKEYGPKGLSPGDHALVGDAGQLMGVLSGGVVVAKASELAQVICSQAGDLLRLLGRNCDIITGFGKISFENNGDRTSMTLRGGSNFSTQTSPQRNNAYTIHADLGATGDLVNFKITNQAGDDLAKIHYNPNGDVTRVSNNVSDEIRGILSEYVQGDVARHVGGNIKTTVNGNVTSTYAQNNTTEVYGTNTTTAIRDQTVNAMNDIKLTAGRNVQLTASGDVLNVPGAAAMKTTVANGSWVIDIGNPLSGDVGSPLSGFDLSAFLGDLSLSTKLGKISLRSTIPDSILLGGQVPVGHAVIFEMLASFLTQLGTLLDTHIHTTVVGPTSPPNPIFAPVSDNIPLLRSQYVTLGG